jgi:hypothetical protein
MVIGCCEPSKGQSPAPLERAGEKSEAMGLYASSYEVKWKSIAKKPSRRLATLHFRRHAASTVDVEDLVVENLGTHPFANANTVTA